mmetsp:Transcript_13960/g.17312  ORF Transcript_13960/g.17312 Transcript_13960/m.17312 type:complete len:128 (-) Transcript_13960:452-835(-)|eukprot:CAMPEP_0204823044 /NCGR_PEP_ID=MMETSP1346-20131115/1204_1 /ASSEMBLY_ACC=CAM_ASM_000771 /TAXON_ID=215587 /ORGANISM="Aplanochytrium stocchinoi, Strain GSBS06" /LENGTH=127 /DNA_ID=CAMNT_0051949573 /DNA_START=89 /DNA_END=472 /DNA_ORIENTATION=+
MVVKTDICSFSEFRVYPGHGIRFVRRDGQLMTFISKKSKSLYNQNMKPAKLTWTISWRRLNKKMQKDENTRTRKRKTQKATRGVVGVSIESLRKKKNEKPEQRQAAREAALREVKERMKKKKGGKKK